MNKIYEGGIYWLLDSRFDFLLPSFMQEFGIENKDITFVNSYHWKRRDGFHKMQIPLARQNVVNLMEPDDMNRFFAQNQKFDSRTLLISFTGAGLPQSKNLSTVTVTGRTAYRCNDKWWQYGFLMEKQVATPCTYKYDNYGEMEAAFPSLIDRHKKIIIKKPCLSGGYKMKAVACSEELEQYQRTLQKSDMGQVFLASEYVAHLQSLAGMGIVCRDGRVYDLNIITEQVIYRETAYEGLIYPAFIDPADAKKISNMTIKIGKGLAENGYYGFFNVDFILGNKQLFVVEINARLGFGTILAACLYQQKFWKMLMRDAYTEIIKRPQKRLVIGKIKAREGSMYSGLRSVSGLQQWFQKEDGFFQTFYCGTDEPELFEYGSFLGLFGEYFEPSASRESVLDRFWERCLEYYYGTEKG